MYEDGESCDKALFSEQRSNVKLAAGDHFTKKEGYFWSRIRESKSLSQDQKIRITKNHTSVVSKIYQNNILSLKPGVKAMPQDEKDLRHVKSAELSNSVWEYFKAKHDWKSKVAGLCQDFIDTGEVAAEVIFDPGKGRFLGFEQALDDDGFPLFETSEGESTIHPQHPETGEPHAPMASDQASFSGDLMVNRLIPANIIRPAEAKTMDEARWLCIREMVHISDLKKMVADDEDKMKLVQANDDETWYVFDGQRNQYGTSKKQTLVRKFYFRPGVEYPNGYYFITTKEGILFEGELPFGLFPIIFGGFDAIATTPRYRSIIKQLRPIQSEINRAASKMAETQITLGDDKVILQNGSKVTTGPQLPGIRTMFVTGQAPTTMPGRTGDQYLPYLQAQIAEFYQVAGVDLDSALNAPTDPWASYFRSVAEKKKYSLYADKFESFLVRIFELYMQLAKNYFDDNMLIPAIGKSEYINISEFKTQEPLFTRIKAEPVADDLTTLQGKTLTYNHILQYAGSSLQKDDIGKIIRMMPFANAEEGFDDFTLDYDSSTNIILALDRGQQVQPKPKDNAEYILKRLAARQKKADFQLLSPQIQQAYGQLEQAYDQILAQQAQALKQAQAQFIPSGGANIKVAYYVKDPTNPDRSVQAVLPAESVDWLMKQLASQGSAQDQLMEQDPATRTNIANAISGQGPVPRQLHQPMMPGQAPQGPNPMQQQVPGSPGWMGRHGA
jgi:hypothetical protein